jgi:hypothetical protein
MTVFSPCVPLSVTVDFPFANETEAQRGHGTQDHPDSTRSV